MEFSGVRPPNSAMVTAESAATLNLFWSAAVPKNTLPLALKCPSRPVSVGVGPAGGTEVGGGGGTEVGGTEVGGGGGTEVGGTEVGGTEVGGVVAVPGKHWK